MIMGTVDTIGTYKGIHPNLDVAIDYIIKAGKDIQAMGIKTGNENVGGGVGVHPDRERGEKVEYEAHRKYIDIHYVIKGEEVQGYAPLSAAKPTMEFNEKEDYVLLEADGVEHVVREGEFCIYFPCDAHASIISNKDLVKAILKIKI